MLTCDKQSTHVRHHVPETESVFSKWAKISNDVVEFPRAQLRNRG